MPGITLKDVAAWPSLLTKINEVNVKYSKVGSVHDGITITPATKEDLKALTEMFKANKFGESSEFNTREPP